MSRAEYMREYRAKKKAEAPSVQPYAMLQPSGDVTTDQLADDLFEAMAVVAALTDEVARLKRELASRPSVETATVQPLDRDTATAIHVNSRSFAEFRPAPKPVRKGK